MRRQPVAVEVYMDVTFTRFDEAEHIVVILMRIVDRGMLHAVCRKYTKVYAGIGDIGSSVFGQFFHRNI